MKFLLILVGSLFAASLFTRDALHLLDGPAVLILLAVGLLAVKRFSDWIGDREQDFERWH